MSRLVAQLRALAVEGPTKESLSASSALAMALETEADEARIKREQLERDVDNVRTS